MKKIFEELWSGAMGFDPESRGLSAREKAVMKRLATCGLKPSPTLPKQVGANGSSFFAKKEPPVKAVLTVSVVYQITIRLSGAMYIWSVSFTSKVVYHSVKFLGGILARRMAGP